MFDKGRKRWENQDDQSTLKPFVMLTRKTCLETPRLTLRPFLESDYQKAVELFKDPTVYATYMLPDLKTEEESRKLFNYFQKASNDLNAFVYAVSYQNAFVGFINHVTKDEESIEVGYCIHPEYQNRGFATEAFKRAIEELFRIGYRKIRAGHFRENPASRRVMEKAGLTPIELVETINYRGSDHVVNYLEIVRK